MGTYLERAVARERRGHHKSVHGLLSGDGDFLFHWSVGPDVPQAIGKSLHSTSWQVRLEAVNILAEMAAGDQADFAREWLGRLLNDPDARIRQAVENLFAEEVFDLPVAPPAAIEPPPPVTAYEITLVSHPEGLDTVTNNWTDRCHEFVATVLLNSSPLENEWVTFRLDPPVDVGSFDFSGKIHPQYVYLWFLETKLHSDGEQEQFRHKCEITNVAV